MKKEDVYLGKIKYGLPFELTTIINSKKKCIFVFLLYVMNKTQLDNGLLIISEFVPNIGSFAAGVCLNVGSRDDFENKEGIAHFMDH